MTTIADIKTRKCMKCKQERPLSEFAHTKSRFFPAEHSLLCNTCLEASVKPTDLAAVDKLMQYLDLPFDPDKWTRLYDSYGAHTLTAYLNTIDESEAYLQNSWGDLNEQWRLAIEEHEAEHNIGAIREANERKLAKTWSPEYELPDLLWLDAFYNKIAATQNVSTPILQELARDLCEIELLIKKNMRAGADVKKYMDSRDNIIKMGHFDASNAKNSADFDTVGELMAYCGKKGWHPDWHQEPQDSVDFTMVNVQQYLQRLFSNEPSMVEQLDDAREKYNIKEKVEELGQDNFEFKDETPDEFEGEDELAGELNVWTTDGN